MPKDKEIAIIDNIPPMVTRQDLRAWKRAIAELTSGRAVIVGAPDQLPPFRESN